MNTSITPKRKGAFICGATVGAVVFFLIYGFSVIVPVNVSWLHHSVDLEGLADLTQHELGWEMYRRSPWLFPAGLFWGLSPEPLSIVYTDSIPLFAVIFKILSPLLPRDFQYMGIFELLTYILMGGFGALIVDSGNDSADNTQKSWRYLYIICSSLIMVTSPVLTKRVFYHTALSAHFLILAAMLLLIYRKEAGRKKCRIGLLILVLLATLINAYYIPMVLGIYCMGILYDILSGEKKEALLDMASVMISGVSAIAAGFFLGMFEGSVSSSAENMERVSFNLNGLINPGNDILTHLKDMPLYDFSGAQSYSLFFNGLKVYSPWQSEGFSYLGLGMIILTVAALFCTIRNKKNTKLMVSIVITGLVFLFLAMGPVGTFGSRVLYTIPWPKSIYSLLSVFRTTGRFIWVVYYGIITLTLLYVCRSKNRILGALLIACTAIQLLDISPSLIYKHEVYGAAASKDEHVNELMESEAFSYLGQQCDEIIFVNPTAAIRMRPYWSVVFEEYALENDMVLNAAYCSRDTTASADRYSDENLEKRIQGEKFPEVLYVFINREIMEEQSKKFRLNVYEYGNIYIGTDLDLSGYDELREVPNE